MPAAALDLLAAGQVGRALLLLEPALAPDPADPGLLMALADEAQRTGGADAALRATAEFVGDHPRNVLGRRVQAALLLGAGQAEEAVSVLSALGGLEQPAQPQTIALMAEAARRLGAMDQARQLLRAAARLAPRSPGVAGRPRALDAPVRPVQPARAAGSLAAAPATPAVERVDLAPFFAYPGRYAVLRLPAEFPGYREHSDLDVLCDDLPAFRAHLEACAAPYLARGFRLEAHPDGPHLHLDLFRPGGRQLDLRFDLSASVPALYPKAGVDPALTALVLDERQAVQRGGANVWVPSTRHELALRFLEYLEWHERRPDKKKHLDHIDRANDFSFLEVLNGYTGLWALLDTDAGQASIDLGEKTSAERADLVAVRAHPPRRRRFDYFMVWGHGLAYAEEMMAAIRQHPAFRILTVVKHRVDDVARFVQRVYEVDTVPMHHLVGKTRYLLTTPPEILFILVQNLDPQEAYFGEGAFRHIQCRNVKAVKEELRNRFNPRKDGRRTEDHVIHGSDYESQVRHMLKVLGLPPAAHYLREPNPRIHAPYHIQPFERFTVRDVPVADLRARILGKGDVPLGETPHARYLAGAVQEYAAYHAAHMGRELTDDHFPGAFERLRRVFDPDRTERDGKLDLILAVPLAGGCWRIIDGVHRGALLLHHGKATARVIVPEWPAQAAPAAPAVGPQAPAPPQAVTPPQGRAAPGGGEYVLSASCQIPGLAALYKLFLGYRADGCFVEFGAFDGEYVSNTSGLADLGWRGLYIEPVPEYHAKCRARHARNRNVTVVNHAVGDSDREIEIHVGGPLSTASGAVLDKFKSLSWSSGYHRGSCVRVRQRPLEDLLRENGIEPGFDLMVVDVEGYEWTALRAFDIARWSPRMVVIELHDNNATYDNEWADAERIVEYFEPHYRVVFKDTSNTVYVRRGVRQVGPAR